jgi:hypothetical protein
LYAPNLKEKPKNCKLLIESEVEYSIDNPTLSGVNNEFLEFDIDVASMLNSEDFYSGEMLIDYNSLTFGTNLASSGRVTLTKGTVITAPNYTLNVVDVSPDQMKVVIQNTSSNPSNYYTITNQSEELAHIKIDISNLAGNTEIEFDEVQMQGLSEMFDASISSNTPFDLVTASDELNIDINAILNGSTTCTTCLNGVWNQSPNPCQPVNCDCPASITTNILESVPTLYYQCQDVSFKDCDATEHILLWSNRPNENVQIYDGATSGPAQGWNNSANPSPYNYAGVPTLWFYGLSQGGGGVAALGINVAENILVATLERMEQNATVNNNQAATSYTFEEFRDYTIDAVIGLHGACSTEHESVVESWISVGLFDCANINISFEENDPTPADPCDKELTAIVNNGSGCYNFEWFEIDNGNPINLNLTTQTIPVTCNKVYRVKVTDTYLGTVVQPCEHEDNHSVFATSTRKVEELNLDVTIRPTLANNQIFFDLEIEEPTIITISIFDQLGRRISQPIVSEKVYQGNRTIQHNVENLSSGIYFVNIETPKGKIVKKFVKM